ncbi:TetR/AcrR family transcriptional regulator [Massilia glaciei]|uniref:TetR/AcrR family transcriptional regulator n=1 Tax=Massilia glaciei TaxID=1524097 RepID=A0A2U2I724_9BURK|nr:TetR/AcrR family transcriptional regulator [Massilia glaciei]PWF55495.1 TetR/AcrR family transcriptional regulator [Massilia glaciei]
MSTVRTVKADTPKAPRRRLAPEDRVEQILDCAGQLIMDGGLTEISMERLGRDAGVSKALIYNYFPNLTDLLRALLEREIVHLREKSVRVIADSGDFADMIRQTTRMYVEHIATRGSLLQRLWQEPSVARAVADKNLHSKDEATRYFVKRVRKEYGLPLEVAIAAVDMQMSMTETAAQHNFNSRDDIDLATDICVRLLLGGLEALAKAYQDKPEAAPAPAKKRAAPAAEKASKGVSEVKATKPASAAKATKPARAAKEVKPAAAVKKAVARKAGA